MSNKRPVAAPSPGFQVRSVTNGGPFDFHDSGAVQPGGGGEHFQVVKKRKADAAPDADKVGKDKGLKSITLKVCDVVRERRVTNYPDVADALVLEVLGEQESKSAGFTSPLQTGDGTEPQSWEKNIRRRVYDALNVLCVMDVIEKQQKNIVWKGLPDQASSHYQSLCEQKEALRSRIAAKTQDVQEMAHTRQAFQALFARNKQRSASASQATEIGITADEVNTVVAEDVSRRIKLPFILISTNASTQVDGQISKDSTSVMLDFSEGFTLSDDEQLLRLLGLVGNALPVIPEMQ